VNDRQLRADGQANRDAATRALPYARLG